MSFHSGAVDYFTEAYSLVSAFGESEREDNDDYNLFSIKTTPNPAHVMNGSDICRSNQFPSHYSFLFKIKVNSNKFAVTLFQIENQFSITLDLCASAIIVTYDGDGCSVGRRELELSKPLETDKWHKIGLAFSDDGIELMLNCRSEIVVAYNICSVACNEDTHVSILTPAESVSSKNDKSSCQSGGDAKVIAKQSNNNWHSY